MSISVTGKLNRSANQFQAKDNLGFGIRIGVKFYNRETKAQEWTNYEALVFAKAGAQSEFYASALVEGSVIEVSGSGCQIKTWESTNGPVNSIAILDAKLGYVSSNDTPQSIGQTPQPTKQVEFDAEIPF
tara:strand:+ start:65 stop:454 length:390 start_codon:yes stop_codon:yes gene_type:complete